MRIIPPNRAVRQDPRNYGRGSISSFPPPASPSRSNKTTPTVEQPQLNSPTLRSSTTPYETVPGSADAGFDVVPGVSSFPDGSLPPTKLQTIPAAPPTMQTAVAELVQQSASSLNQGTEAVHPLSGSTFDGSTTPTQPLISDADVLQPLPSCSFHGSHAACEQPLRVLLNSCQHAAAASVMVQGPNMSSSGFLPVTGVTDSPFFNRRPVPSSLPEASSSVLSEVTLQAPVPTHTASSLPLPQSPRATMVHAPNKMSQPHYDTAPHSENAPNMQTHVPTHHLQPELLMHLSQPLPTKNLKHQSLPLQPVLPHTKHTPQTTQPLAQPPRPHANALSQTEALTNTLSHLLPPCNNHDPHMRPHHNVNAPLIRPNVEPAPLHVQTAQNSAQPTHLSQLPLTGHETSPQAHNSHLNIPPIAAHSRYLQAQTDPSNKSNNVSLEPSLQAQT